MFEPDLAFILQRASEASIGIVISTNNPKLLRNRLYAERKKWDAFSHLSFTQPPSNPEGELWIIKREASHGSPQD